jgi:hypothetical protein
MASEVITWELMGWKGLNTEPNISNKDPQYAEDCQNVDFDEAGLITKRRGTIRVSTTFSGRTNMIYDFQSQLGFKDTNDKHRIVVVVGSSLYVLYDDGSVDATFPDTDILHYGVTSDNGVAYIASEREGIAPYMLCYLGA